MQDLSEDLRMIVRDAVERGASLIIQGGGSKSFYGREQTGEPFSVKGHNGIVNYDPTELVMTARCGTPLRLIESVLADNEQMLAFEPPHFGANATFGGAISCGLSGPRRPFTGAARDFVLGSRIISGTAEILSFGGEVMKNVAGYDVSRLMTGSMGTLGVLLQLSLKVLPRPPVEITLRQEMTSRQAITTMVQQTLKPIPISALAWDSGQVHTRLSGSRSAVEVAAKLMGGERSDKGDSFWAALREQKLKFFHGKHRLWRISAGPATPLLDLSGQWLLDWGGAQRWLSSDEPAEKVFQAVQTVGGHATLFRADERTGQVFHPLSPGLYRIHERIKRAFDPKGVFNPFRMYKEW